MVWSCSDDGEDKLTKRVYELMQGRLEEQEHRVGWNDNIRDVLHAGGSDIERAGVYILKREWCIVRVDWICY